MMGHSTFYGQDECFWNCRGEPKQYTVITLIEQSNMVPAKLAKNKNSSAGLDSLV